MADEHILGLAPTTIASDVDDLIPADVYSTLVLEALYARRAFAGIVAAVEEDLTARAGNVVQVPYISPRTAQGPIAEGTALTENATSTGTYPITLQKFGDADLVNAEVWEDQTIFQREDFINNMGQALAVNVDQQVYDALEAATPGQSKVLTTEGVYTDLYDRIVELKQALKAAKYSPSHLLIHPDQEAQFLKDTDEGIKLGQIAVRDGELLRVAGLAVIVSPLANAVTTTFDEVQGIVIDRSRALGEAWGRRPNTKVDEMSESLKDQVRLVTWLRYGTAVLDTGAIGHIVNPAS